MIEYKLWERGTGNSGSIVSRDDGETKMMTVDDEDADGGEEEGEEHFEVLQDSSWSVMRNFVQHLALALQMFFFQLSFLMGTIIVWAAEYR